MIKLDSLTGKRLLEKQKMNSKIIEYLCFGQFLEKNLISRVNLG